MRTTTMKRQAVLGVTIGLVVFAAAPISLHWSSKTNTLSVSLNTATARVGHPLSPASVAGVRRRTARRAYRSYYGSAAVGAAGAAAYGLAASNYGQGTSDSSTDSGRQRTLYNYAPGASASPAASPAASAAVKGRSAIDGGMGYGVQSGTDSDSASALSPDMLAFCYYRTYGACPSH